MAMRMRNRRLIRMIIPTLVGALISVVIAWRVPSAWSWVRVGVTGPTFLYCGESAEVTARVCSGKWKPNKGDPNPDDPVDVIWTLSSSMAEDGSIPGTSSTDADGFTTVTYDAPAVGATPGEGSGSVMISALTAAPGDGSWSIDIRGIPPDPPSSAGLSQEEFEGYFNSVVRYLRASGKGEIGDALDSLESNCPGVEYQSGLGPDGRTVDYGADNTCDAFYMGPGSLDSEFFEDPTDDVIHTILHEARHAQIMEARASGEPDADGDGVPDSFDGSFIDDAEEAAEDFEDAHPGNLCESGC